MMREHYVSSPPFIWMGGKGNNSLSTSIVSGPLSALNTRVPAEAVSRSPLYILVIVSEWKVQSKIG